MAPDQHAGGTSTGGTDPAAAAAGVEVAPDVLKQAANEFDGCAYTVADMAKRLRASLTALGEPWGSTDRMAKQFADGDGTDDNPGYPKVATSMLSTLDNLTRSLHSIATNLRTDVQNFEAMGEQAKEVADAIAQAVKNGKAVNPAYSGRAPVVRLR
jgi:hypothetical protein